jgi:hypothetical protein
MSLVLGLVPVDWVRSLDFVSASALILTLLTIECKHSFANKMGSFSQFRIVECTVFSPCQLDASTHSSTEWGRSVGFVWENVIGPSI